VTNAFHGVSQETAAKKGKVIRSILTVFMVLFSTSSGFGDERLSVSGKWMLQESIPLKSDSDTVLPSLIGRISADTTLPAWQLHAWVEGGWDGTVDSESRDSDILITYDEVYQRNAAFLEFKEIYGSYVMDFFELRAGIQRFAWGRLDEYPINDHLNPWDYTQFLLKPLEERKIGVPALSATLNQSDWDFQAVWVPWLVSYRLPLPGERWSGFPSSATALTKIPGVEVTPREPDFPAGKLNNGSAGFRLRHSGAVEGAIYLFHGYDSRPVFKTTALTIRSLADKIIIDPGYVPDFHKLTSIGIDGAGVKGDWSLRAEAAYTSGRPFNTRWELWGYPSTLLRRTYTLKPNEHKRDTLQYGIGADHRVFEDCLLILQVQQTVIVDRPDTLYERQVETLAWSSVKTGWMNRKVESNFTIAYNPEHADIMVKANAAYGFTDYWRAGVTAVIFAGDSQSLFGRFSKNDQLGAEIDFFW
jgi:hypothetical protein